MADYRKEDVDEVICSCQVKDYDENKPETWVRPKKVRLHNASDCCQYPRNQKVKEAWRDIFKRMKIEDNHESDKDGNISSATTVVDDLEHANQTSVLQNSSSSEEEPFVIRHHPRTTRSTTAADKNMPPPPVPPRVLRLSSSNSSLNSNHEKRSTKSEPTNIVNGKIVPRRLESVEHSMPKTSFTLPDIWGSGSGRGGGSKLTTYSHRRRSTLDSPGDGRLLGGSPLSNSGKPGSAMNTEMGESNITKSKSNNEAIDNATKRRMSDIMERLEVVRAASLSV